MSRSASNDAAERLLRKQCECGPGPNGEPWKHRPSWAKCPAHDLGEALAAERAFGYMDGVTFERERIRAAVAELAYNEATKWYRADTLAILDAERDR